MENNLVTDKNRSSAIRVIKFMLFTATIAPVILAGAMTYKSEVFTWLNFILAGIGLLIGQAGGDYLYYYFTKNHTLSTDSHTKIFAGWRPFFTNVLPKKYGSLLAGIFCLLIDLAIGYYFYQQFGETILYLAIAGGAMAIFFTPLMLMGLKEIVVFITFGPLSLTGIYYVLTGELSIIPVFASLPVAFLVTIVAYLKGAKFKLEESEGQQLVVKLNRQLITSLTILAYMSIPVLVFTNIIPAGSMLGLAAIFISLTVLKVIQNRASEVHDYLWAVVRSIIALLVTTILISAGFIFI